MREVITRDKNNGEEAGVGGYLHGKSWEQNFLTAEKKMIFSLSQGLAAGPGDAACIPAG